MKRKSLLMLLLINVLCTFTIVAQQKVTGVVLDSQQRPLPGVNVVENGTTNGTVTDTDGNYSLTVPSPESKITFSFIGFVKMEVVVGNQSTINIELEEESIGLDEVVTIGYGTQRRKDITSSITTVSAEDMTKGVVTNAAQLLQGKVPGLSITRDGSPDGGVSSILLRGASTLRGNASPLFVVDGIPGGTMPAPEDIASMDVLRDASATAIYGSRAANGVIMITTKKGSASQTEVTYHGYLAYDQVASKYDMMSADQYRSFLEKNNQMLDPGSDLGASTDWQDEVQRSGFAQNHHFSLSGGTKQTSYNASVSFLDHQGLIETTEMDQIKSRIFIEQKALNDRLKLSFNFMSDVKNSSSGVVNQKDGKTVFGGMLYYLPTVPVQLEDGSYYENDGISQNYNPMGILNQHVEDRKTKQILGSIKASLNIVKGLDYDITLSMKDVQTNRSKYTDSGALLEQGKNGVASRDAYEATRENMEMYLNYYETFGKHDVKALLGYSWEEEKFGDGVAASTYNFPNDELLYYNMNLGNPPAGYTPDYGGGRMTKRRMISYFGRVNYGFDNKYLFQAVVRRDGSSAFGENYRWGTFPSVSAAWRLSEETFVKDWGVFDDLKMRIGYGESGNSSGFDPFVSQLKYGRAGTYYKNGDLVPAIGPTQNANPDLRWETTSMFNIGLDFAFFNNRLSGTIEWYDKNTNDLIWQYPVSTTKYLVPNLVANVGEINNTGYEITLNATPVHNNGWMWSTTLNLAHNNNEVVSLSNEEFGVDYIWTAELNGRGQSGNMQQTIEEGKPIGQFYLWDWAGYNDEGVSVFHTKDGGVSTTPSSNDKIYAGDAQPDMVYGWDNNVSYKGWNLNIFFRGVSGNDVLNASYAKLNYMAEMTHFNQLASEMDAPTTDINSHYLSTRYLESGSYLRLENLALSYDLNMNNNDYIKKLKLYVSCNNVFTVSSYKGIDPEVSLGGLEPGIDFNNFYPKARTFMFGINLTL